MNFEKDLREYTDDELYVRMNQHDPRFGSLYSDELTRRSADKWSQKIVDLTILLFFVGFLQLFISFKSILSSWGEWFFGVIMVFYAVFYVARLAKNKKERSKK